MILHIIVFQVYLNDYQESILLGVVDEILLIFNGKLLKVTTRRQS